MKYKVIGILSLVAAVAVIVMIYTILNTKNTEYIFDKPAFDANALNGTPSVDDSLGWAEVSSDELTFKAYICGEVNIQNNQAELYFTNDSTSKSWIKLRVINSSNKIIAETGLIKPGEYIEKVELSSIPEVNSTIEFKIMAYEPETYYSDGSVILETTIKSIAN